MFGMCGTIRQCRTNSNINMRMIKLHSDTVKCNMYLMIKCLAGAARQDSVALSVKVKLICDDPYNTVRPCNDIEMYSETMLLSFK